MNRDLSFRRRAIYTGLKPYMEEDALMEALLFWQAQFAEAPRFTLQRFVSELCRGSELRTRRADILLSLVQAMNMPAASLLPDPLRDSTHTPAIGQHAQAFTALLDALFSQLDDNTRYQLRLDMLAQLERLRLPQAVHHALQRWLNDKSDLPAIEADTRTLQAVVNSAYVQLCAQLGPVVTDRLLAAATDSASTRSPALRAAISALL